LGFVLEILEKREREMPITYEGHFEHGVASGDPLSDSIVLWTRVTPKTSSGVVVESISCGKDALAFRVKYFVKNEEDEVVISGVEEALCSNDWTLKVDVVGLNGGVKYSYGFETNSFSSRLGTFRLFSSEQNTLKFAVFSCANFGYGYFNAYGHAASLDLDFSLFLGDYIYEYDPSGYHIVRQSEDLLPRGTRLDNITDYRKRYESYHKDPDLQALRASAPLIAAWDDHEFANDAYKVGAGNHDDSVDGPWEPRKQAAARVFEVYSLPLTRLIHLHSNFNNNNNNNRSGYRFERFEQQEDV
jgi:alkaline phosphatase D